MFLTRSVAAGARRLPSAPTAGRLFEVLPTGGGWAGRSGMDEPGPGRPLRVLDTVASSRMSSQSGKQAGGSSHQRRLQRTSRRRAARERRPFRRPDCAACRRSCIGPCRDLHPPPPRGALVALLSVGQTTTGHPDDAGSSVRAMRCRPTTRGGARRRPRGHLRGSRPGRQSREQTARSARRHSCRTRS